MFAHFQAFSNVARSNERTMILEDDIVVPPSASGPSTDEHINAFLHTTMDADIAYVGHCFDGLCCHAMAVTPLGAQKVLNQVQWCSNEEVDVQLVRMCNSGQLKCAYAESINSIRDENIWGDGLINQRAGTEVRNREWFP